MDAARAQGDENAVRIFEEHRALLRRCREAGIPRAFAEKLLPPEMPPAFRADLQQAQEAEQRYLRAGHLVDLDTAAAAWERILRHPDFPRADERFQLAAWNDAAVVFIRHHEATGYLPDLDRAMAIWQEAIVRTPEGSPDWASMQAGLGVALSIRFEALGQVADLDAAIEACHKALGVAREGSPDWARWQANLGVALRTRFAALGQVADLDAAIEAYHKALGVAREGSPDWAARQANLGGALIRRFEALGQVADLDAAIEAYHKALGVAREGSPDWASMQANLGVALSTRFAALGQVADLDAAIEAYHKALGVAREGSPDWAARQANLGVALSTRFEALGQVADLDAAIEAYGKALGVAREGSPDWATMQANLGGALIRRFEALGEVADLDAAIEAYHKALGVEREGSPDWARWQANLGVALSTRFAALGQVADLGAAIEACHKALGVAREGSPDWAKWQANLGVALRRRFEALGQVADLDAAIEAYHKALGVAREGSPDWASMQANLGVVLSTRFEALGQVADLGAAIEAYHKALGVAREGSPDWASMQANLGVALSIRFEALGQVADLDAAIEAYHKALGAFSPDTFPDYTLTAALPLGWLLFRRRKPADLKAAVEVYRKAAPAAQHLYFEATHPGRRQRELRRAQSIPAHYAYALASQGEHRAAVEALEAGRARQLAEAFLSAQVEARFQGDAALQGAWREVQGALSLYNHADEKSRPQAEEQVAQARRAYYDRLRVAFPEFFQAPAFEQIAQAAAEMPIVYLLATPAGGLALIVHGDGVTPVPLEGLTEEALNGWLVWTDEEGKNVIGGYLPAQLAVSGWMPQALERLLPELGEKVMRLVAEALRALTPPPAAALPPPLLSRRAGEGVRAVTLIPTGRLALLPLHAARYRRDGRELCFLDEFAVAYAPSATTLREARRLEAAPSGPPRLVGVGNPLPLVESLTGLHRQLQEAVAALPADPTIASLRAELQKLVARSTAELRHEGFLLRRLILRLPERLGEPVKRLVELSREWPLSLRYAKAELQSVVDLLPPDAAVPFYEEAATRAALLPHLAGARWLHFSCHGSFDPQEPLDSALHLAGDDRLTLRDMLTPGFIGLDVAHLVVLSACQTAITDFRDLPEESIGLPAGLLQAGAPAVIGTLWPVDDASTALLMTRTYELLLEGNLPAEALRQAQGWLRDLTNAELEAYLTRHQAIAEARRQAAQRMPFSLIEELLIRVFTTDDPAARPYADPYFWAPFTFSGASHQVTVTSKVTVT